MGHKTECLEKRKMHLLYFSPNILQCDKPRPDRTKSNKHHADEKHTFAVSLWNLPDGSFITRFGQFNLVYALSWFEVFIGNWPRKVSDYPYRFHAFCFSGTFVHIFCEKQILQVTVRWRACVLSVSVRWLDGKPEALTWKQVDETASRRRHALMSQILLTVCRNQRGSVLI